MNTEALRKVVGHIAFFACHPTNIQFNVNMDLGLSEFPQTFTRFQWQCIGEGVPAPDAQSENNGNNFLFLINTVAQIAIQPESGPIPESEPIPDTDLVCQMDINFAVMYRSDIPRDDLDAEGLQEFVMHNVPYHFWPYWRELIQNLAMRSQLPIPMLPPYRVPDAAQSLAKAVDAKIAE